jgi:hypothetical protein
LTTPLMICQLSTQIKEKFARDNLKELDIKNYLV